jgi:hypothetical protein
MAQYLDELWCEPRTQRDCAPQTPYRFVGGTALAREEECPGSGQVTWSAPEAEGPIEEGLLDGFGLYSEKPTALVVEIKQLAYPFDSAGRHGQDSEPLLPRPS